MCCRSTHIAARDVEPDKPLWEKTNPPLQKHIRVTETEATYALPVWPDAPSDEEVADHGQILNQIKVEWTSQIKAIREAAAAAEKAKVDNQANQCPSKQLVKQRKRPHL